MENNAVQNNAPFLEEIENLKRQNEEVQKENEELKKTNSDLGKHLAEKNAENKLQIKSLEMDKESLQEKFELKCQELEKKKREYNVSWWAFLIDYCFF